MKELLDEPSRFEGYGLGHVKEAAPADLREELPLGRPVKREHSREHHEEDYTEGPDICCEARVLLLLDDLGSHV